jgi:RNA polymerase sigma-70 factor (ECF subfamily)
MTNKDSLSDGQLIELYLNNGSQVSLQVLCERYEKKVFSKCYSMTKSREVAEDLRQDIMLKMIDKLHLFKGLSSYSTWLYSITYNHCIEHLRKYKRVRFDDLKDLLDIPDEVADDEIETVLQLRLDRINFLLELLKPEDKAILLMKYKEGFDLKQIMEISQISGASATKMRLKRAKARLMALYNKFLLEV